MGLGKKVVFITSGQPALNPRLVKEVNSLKEKGFEVTVIYQYWNAWGTALDTDIIRNWNTFRVGGDPIHERSSYLLSRLIFKISTWISQKIILINPIAELALGRCTTQLISKAKSIQADLYIAHNLAALPAAVKAAQKNQAKCGFDAEDFHRNEVSDEKDSFDVRLKTLIEEKYIPQLTYLSTASPLISEAYQALFPLSNPTTLLNVFPKQVIKAKAESSGGLKLFWFSQTIGKGRGLEAIIEAISILNLNIELHLLGQYDAEIQAYFEQITGKYKRSEKFIHYHSPIPAAEIYEFASKFDVGLATEISKPKNRDLCLTNKIFTYAQAGLAIIASATSAQKDLLHKYPNMGLVYEQDSFASLLNSIKRLIENHELLNDFKQNASRYAAEELNWEKEKEKFLTLINLSLF